MAKWPGESVWPPGESTSTIPGSENSAGPLLMASAYAKDSDTLIRINQRTSPEPTPRAVGASHDRATGDGRMWMWTPGEWLEYNFHLREERMPQGGQCPVSDSN